MWNYDEWAEYLSDLSLLNQGMKKKKKKEDRYDEPQGKSSLFKKLYEKKKFMNIDTTV